MGRLCCSAYNYFRSYKRIFAFFSGDDYRVNITYFFPTTITLSAAQIYATLSLLKNKECYNLVKEYGNTILKLHLEH